MEPHEGAGEDVLRSPEAGARVIRGGALRGIGYAAGVGLTAIASVFLLRYLGVTEFGRYATVMSLVAIVSGVTDAGLTAVGARDLPRRPGVAARRRLLANLVALRLVLTPLGVLATVSFTLVAGYDEELVLGTLIAGAGLVLVNTQATLMLPLSVELRIGRLTTAEVLRQTLIVVAIAALVAIEASLLPFFAVTIAVGTILLAVTPLIVDRDLVARPALNAQEWRSLVREALPIAAFLVMNVIYFRVLIVLLSLIATARETGLFATSFRIFEIVFGIATLVMTVALPVLSVAREHGERFRYALQRLTEVAAVAAAFLALVVIAAAEPVIALLGGEEYRDAASILRIQAVALVAVFLGQAWQLALISINRQRALALANGFALVVVVALGLALVPSFGTEGAAIAAVAAEACLAGALLALLARADRSFVPDLRFLWKPAAATGVGAAAVAVLTVDPLAAAAIAAALYAAIAWVTGAVPREVVDALVARRAA